MENLVEIEHSNIVAYWTEVLMEGDKCDLAKYHLKNGYDTKSGKWKCSRAFNACTDFIKFQIKYMRPGRGCGIGLDFIAEEIKEDYPEFSIN